MASDAALNAVIGEVLGHALGEGGDEDALVTMGGVELYAPRSAFSRAPTDGYDRPAIGLLYELPEQGGPGAG